MIKSRNIIIFVVIVYAAVLNTFMLQILYSKTKLVQNGSIVPAHSLNNSKPLPSLFETKCEKVFDNSIVIKLSETQTTNYGIMRLLKQFEIIMPNLKRPLYLLTTAETFSTSLRLWCKQHNDCILLVARSEDVTEQIASILARDTCSKNFVVLSDDVRIDTTFLQRLEFVADKRVTCLLKTGCKNKSMAWKMPRFFLIDNIISQYDDIAQQAALSNLLDEEHAIVKV